MFKSLARALVRHWRVFFLFVLGVGIFVQIVGLLPRGLEEDVAPKELVKSDIANAPFLKPRRPGFAPGLVPDYTIKGFQYVSVERGVKQWKVLADEAYFFEKPGMVTLREVHAEIYDSQGRITTVESKEGEYSTIVRDLNLYERVISHFPDGFITHSGAAYYDAKKKIMTSPPDDVVTGNSLEEFGKDSMRFTSTGAMYNGFESKLYLQKDVHVTITNPPQPARAASATEPAKAATAATVTDIYSDNAVIDRAADVGNFAMVRTKSAKPRLVRIEQPGTDARARRAKFNFSAVDRHLTLLNLYEDVTIVETPRPDEDGEKVSPRVATGGEAAFDARKDTIRLEQYPQVAQDHDTITGEIITIFRDTDQVEVERSNAYSERKENK